MLRSGLCNYSNAYILVNGTITINGTGANNAVNWLDEKNQGVIIKNCSAVINCANEINKI